MVRNNDGIVKLDERDARLLQLIDLDARTTFAALAKALRISKPAAKRRLERLEEAGVIRRYIAIINLPKLGYNSYTLSLKLHRLNSDDIAAFAKELSKWKETGWVLRAIGQWDLLLILYAQDAARLESSYRKFLEPIAGNVAQKAVSVLSSFTHLSCDFLSEKRREGARRQITVGGELDPVPLDELDHNLLNVLSQDGRASLVKLAGKLDVTPKTIRNRMRRLEKAGVILGYNAVFDTARIGYEHHKIYLYLTHLDEEAYKKVRGYVTSLPETVLFSEAVSSADLDFDVRVSSTARLHEIIRELRDRYKELVSDVQTLLITDEDVIDYTPHR